MCFHAYSFAQILQLCNSRDSVRQGRQLHALFLKNGFLGFSLSVCNCLLQMYARCRSMVDACQLFDDMTQRNCFTWNTMIEGYVKSGEQKKAFELFKVMTDKNDFSWNLMISAFLKTGEIEHARYLFNSMPNKNVVVWNSLIHAYVQNGCPNKALSLFKDLSFDSSEVSRCDTFIMATVIKACTDLLYFNCGRQIHACIHINNLPCDPVLETSLINFYGKCGDLICADHILNTMNEPNDFSLSALISAYASCSRTYDARRIFDRKSFQSVIVWNSMISGYVSNSEDVEALALFNHMRRQGVHADPSTLASIFSASSSSGTFKHGKQMHTLVRKVGFIDDIIVASSLIDTYSKCGNPNDACRLFSELKAHDTVLLNSMITVYSSCGKIEEAKRIFVTMPSKTLVSWNSMIVGLCQNGFPIEAIYLLREMNTKNLAMDKFNMASVISACGCISALKLGTQVFARAIVSGFEFDPIICTSLVDFYSKCGYLENGQKIFERMDKHDEASWNSMLMGYATNGYGTEALALFNEMLLSGVKPNFITFIGVLCACDHCGLVEQGQRWFHSMKSEFHIDPGIEHYSCIVDLYSRAGRVDEAINVIEQMPFEADVSMLSTVLRGCVANGNKILGKKVANRIIELDADNSTAHIQWANILASNMDWEDSEKVHWLMKHKNIQKISGRSWG